MPRPTIYDEDRVQIQFRLPTGLRDRLRKQSEVRMVAVNFLIEKALEDALTTWEAQLGITAPATPQSKPAPKPRAAKAKPVEPVVEIAKVAAPKAPAKATNKPVKAVAKRAPVKV
jgi:hypothetical protein